MKTISTSNAIIVQKSQLTDLLKQAIEHHHRCETAVGSVRQTQRLALWHAWQAGIRLNQMKALIRRGDWADWVDVNFCQPLKISLRTAQVYMKIDHDNPDLREEAKTQRVAPTEADLQVLTKLKFDTIRKYAYTFIPEKEQPNKELNLRLPPLASFVNIANEYNRLRYWHVIGLQDVDFQEAREETVELYHFLQWLHGDAQQNPWDKCTYSASRIRAARRREQEILERTAQDWEKICQLDE